MVLPIVQPITETILALSSINFALVLPLYSTSYLLRISSEISLRNRRKCTATGKPLTNRTFIDVILHSFSDTRVSFYDDHPLVLFAFYGVLWAPLRYAGPD